MATRRLLLYPDPALRKKSAIVETFDSELEQLGDDLLDSMYQHKGVGLSAPQINVFKRVISIDTSRDRNEPMVLVNPVVIARTEVAMREEGCLSFPGFYEKVKRPQKIAVEAQDVKGEKRQIEVSELAAICIQHEIDHLDGKLFIDYLSKLRAGRIRRRMVKPVT